MTNKDRIIGLLQNHPEGLDDDEIARILDLSARQQANQRCRELEREGLVIRRVVDGKIHNFWAGKLVHVQSQQQPKTTQVQGPPTRAENWFWEGNVQSKVVSFLATQGYKIRSVVDTASHQQGIDIVAEKGGRQLWVSVKGYPQGTAKTNATVQAAHWFKQAIFDIIEYRERDKDVMLAVALPDFPRYQSLKHKITWLKPVARYSYFWVKSDGEVTIE